MEVAAESEDIVFDSVDEELAKVSGMHAIEVYIIYTMKLLFEYRLTVCGSLYLYEQWHRPLS